MPIYEYHCNKCDIEFEKIIFSSSEEINCPTCNTHKVKKLMSGFSHKSGDSFTSSAGPSCSGCASSNCNTCH